MLSTTVMATKSTVLIAPAMNTNMYTNSIVQDNIEKLKHYGYTFIEPSCGYLACGDIGQGKLPDEALLTEHIISQIAFRKDFIGKRILVTAGPTRERMDPVRYISNHSTGKMGYAIAKMAQRRGAQVTLVSGPTSLPAPLFCNFILVESAAEMFESVTSLAHDQDIIIKAAAVADYRPITIADEKIKKDNKMFTSNIELESTKDILKHLGEHRHSKQILCGFSMETENMIENSKKKLKKKNIDLIAANNLKEKGAGFATDTNRLTLITSDSEETLPMVSKDDAAGLLLDKIYSLIKQ